jgi:S-adenosylmethionine uptake transporter
MSDNTSSSLSPHAVSGRSNLRAILIVLFSFAIFSGTDVTVKLLADHIPVPQVTFMVTIVALVLCVGHSLWSGSRRDLLPRYPALAFLRAVLLSLDTLLIYYAFARLSLSEAYMLAFLTPILVALLAAILLGERMSLIAWSGVILGFAGVTLALRPGIAPLNLGHAAAIGSAVCFAFSLVILRRAKTAESDTALVITFMVMLALVALVTAVLGGGLVMPTARDLLLALAGGLMMFGGHMGLVKAFRLGDASVVAPFQYSQIIWGCLFGLLIFNTPVDPFTLAGAAIIIFSGWLVLK